MIRPGMPTRIAAFGLLLGAGTTAGAATTADLVLTGGAVYTMDAARSWAQALAVRDGRIVYVGSDAGARAFVAAKTRVVRLDGRMVLPAFQDAHIHPLSGGLELGLCDLNDLATKDAILDKLRECAKTEKPWLLGGGWALPAFPNAAPTRDLLDAIVPDRPAYLTAADGHSGWVNSKAIELAGITKDTPDPENGRIERDPATGEPTGTLREAADDLIEGLLPKTGPDDTAGSRAGEDSICVSGRVIGWPPIGSGHRRKGMETAN